MTVGMKVLKIVANIIYFILKLMGVYVLMVWFFLSLLPDIMMVSDNMIDSGFTHFRVVPVMFLFTGIAWWVILAYKIQTSMTKKQKEDKVNE